MFDLQYLGHAGWLVQKEKFKMLCDPWFSPQGAYLEEWFPFPDNRHVYNDELLVGLDLVYISHVHQDHCDEWFLKKLDKKTPIFIPNFSSKTLYNQLQKLGFFYITEFEDTTKITIKDIKIRIIRDESYLDNDSCILLESDGVKILNLNDCHIDFTKLRKIIGEIDLLLLQSSSAIWFPCAYEYSEGEMVKHGTAKRHSVLHRTLKYAKRLKAKMVIPNAGPPIINNPQMERWNFNKREKWNPFVLPDDSCRFLQKNNINSTVVLPGARVKIDSQSFINTTENKEIEKVYSNIDKYTRAYLDSLSPRTSLLYSTERKQQTVKRFGERIDKIKRISKFYCAAVSYPSLFDFKEFGKWCVDFKKPEAFQKYIGQSYCYSFKIDPNDLCYIMESDINDFEILFLSMRFNCKRDPDVYDEMLFAILKHFDLKRFVQSEKLYANRPEITDDSFQLKHDEKCYTIQKYCPHMFANLEEVGYIDGESVVCPLHGWKFDLKTGECHNKKGYSIKVQEHDKQ